MHKPKWHCFRRQIFRYGTNQSHMLVPVPRIAVGVRKAHWMTTRLRAACGYYGSLTPRQGENLLG